MIALAIAFVAAYTAIVVFEIVALWIIIKKTREKKWIFLK